MSSSSVGRRRPSARIVRSKDRQRIDFAEPTDENEHDFQMQWAMSVSLAAAAAAPDTVDTVSNRVRTQHTPTHSQVDRSMLVLCVLVHVHEPAGSSI